MRRVPLTTCTLWTLDETADLGSRSNIAAVIARFSHLNKNDQVAELAARLKTISDSGFVPCLVDAGGERCEARAGRPLGWSSANRAV